MPFRNPILGGSVLVRNAMQSADYVAGVSGWALTRLGSFEANDATIRGTLTAGGGEVTVDEHGVRVADIGGTVEYLVNRTGGFVVRNIPDNGGLIELANLLGLSFIPMAGNPAPNGSGIFDRGRVSAAYDAVGTELAPTLDVVSPVFNGGIDTNIKLRGEGSSGVAQPYILLDCNGGAGSSVEANAEFMIVNHKLLSGSTGMYFCPMQLFTVIVNVTNNGNIGAVNANLGITNFPTAFPVGSTVWGFANIVTGNAASVGWGCRFLPVSNSQYNINMFQANGGSPAGGVNLTVTVAAFVIPT